MADQKSAQDRFTYDRWQAGRLEFPGRGGDPDDVWIVDVVVVEEIEDEDLRAIARYRPGRGMTPDLGRVIDRAIREPIDGRPHLPALVRVATAELAAEIHKARPELKLVIGPTYVVDDLGYDAAEDLLPDSDEGEDRWRWLERDVTPAQVKRLFDAMSALTQSLITSTLEPGQLLRVAVPSLGLNPGWVHLTSEPAITGGEIISIAIAPDDATRQAWIDDESSDREIAIFGIEQDELPPEAYAELVEHGWVAVLGYNPRVAVGGEAERSPTPQELEIAIAALEAIAGHFDPFAPEPDLAKPRTITLSSGAQATLSAPPDERLEVDDDLDEEEPGFIDIGGEEDEDLKFLELDSARTWTAAPLPAPATFVRANPKPGRNDPCWCGSGQKYKKCHLGKEG